MIFAPRGCSSRSMCTSAVSAGQSNAYVRQNRQLRRSLYADMHLSNAAQSLRFSLHAEPGMILKVPQSFPLARSKFAGSMSVPLVIPYRPAVPFEIVRLCAVRFAAFWDQAAKFSLSSVNLGDLLHRQPPELVHRRRGNTRNLRTDVCREDHSPPRTHR